MLRQQIGAGVGVDIGEIADVVAVRFEPPDHRVLATEEEGSAECAVPSQEWAVVADLRRAVFTATAALVEAEAAVVVVGLPCRVGRLVQKG